MKKTRVTMLDVARAAGVTPQTVSRAIRNTPDISTETRDRILGIAKQLNYVKNNAATSLRVGQSRLIVVVYDVLVNVYFSIMIDHLQRSLRALGYSILVLSVEEKRLTRAAYEFALSHDGAGIVSFLEPDEEIGELIEHFGIPVLLFGRRTETEQIDYLRTDDEEGGRIAARKLIACGCTRPAFLGVSLEVSCSYDRYGGFSEVCKAAGLSPVCLIDGEGGPLTKTLPALMQNSPPDGFFCFSDMIAFDALYILEQYGFPRVKVVGFDAVQQELHIPSRLTSVGTDKGAMAARAAELIVARVELKNPPRSCETMAVSLIAGTTA